MYKIEFNVEDKWKDFIPDHKKIISTAVKKTFKEVFNISKPNIELSIFLTSNKKIQKLNFQHRNKNKPTNILSFPMNLITADNSKVLGDIVIALETIISESQKQRIPKQKYLSKITIHGLLHLLGYDHIGLEEYKEMHQVEKNIFNQIYLK